MMVVPSEREVTDLVQRRRLALPKGDVALADGRILRPRIGYDLRKVASNAVTRRGFLASAGWFHAPSGFRVGASLDDTERWGPLLHVSMSYNDRDPSWEEIKLVKAALFPPDVDAGMILPRAENYVNLHSHCFHLVRLPQVWGIG